MVAADSDKPLITGRRIAMALAFGVCLYVGILLWAAHSEAFHVAERNIKASRSIKEMVGGIESVSLNPLGSLRYHFAGLNESMDMEIDVRGDKGKVLVRLHMRKVGESWQIADAYVGGTPVSL